MVQVARQVFRVQPAAGALLTMTQSGVGMASRMRVQLAGDGNPAWRPISVAE